MTPTKQDIMVALDDFAWMLTHRSTGADKRGARSRLMGLVDELYREIASGQSVISNPRDQAEKECTGERRAVGISERG